MAERLHVLMVAAENDGLRTAPGQPAKAGGIGDVVRDVPPALVELPGLDARVTTVIPSYGYLERVDGARLLETFPFPFAGSREGMALYEAPGRTPHPQIRHLVLHSPRFDARQSLTAPRHIYCDDPPGRPFATDATRFAAFGAAVSEGVRRGLFGGTFGDVNRLHLHDWHATFVLLLAAADPEFAPLRELHTTFTIHNLALQGIRPFGGDLSSLEAWYPHLDPRLHEMVFQDPDYAGCLNPMAVGIRLADAVHVVSPGYKAEILEPTLPRRGDPDAARFGGEGLEDDLRRADDEGRLFGILNGCHYDDRPLPPRDFASYQALLRHLQGVVTGWATRQPDPAHDIALRRLGHLQSSPRRPEAVLTCVTRAVNQKVRLMRIPPVRPALERVLEGLPVGSTLFLLGTGDRALERYFREASARFANFVFLNGFDSTAAAALYAAGDLFLMPSSFEPCGISQMLAMRDGQPCVVHHVGGLKDTVEEGKTGFAFTGATPEEQAQNFVFAVYRAVSLIRAQPAKFQAVREAAFARRFLWSDSVGGYARHLYNGPRRAPVRLAGPAPEPRPPAAPRPTPS